MQGESQLGRAHQQLQQLPPTAVREVSREQLKDYIRIRYPSLYCKNGRHAECTGHMIHNFENSYLECTCECHKGESHATKGDAAGK